MNPFIEYTKWLLKWALIIFGSLVGLALVLGGGAWAWHWWHYDRHVANVTVGIENEDSEKSLASLIGSGGRSCSAEHPIFVSIQNGSSRTIIRTSIAISANLPDYSTDILDYGSNISTDRIIQAGKRYSTCWRFKVKSGYEKEPGLKNAYYKARLIYVEFAND